MHTPLAGIHDIIRLDDVIPESDDPVLRHARRVLNESLRGSLVVEFDCRRVVVSDVPGDVAMRFHAIVADHRAGDPSSARWADQHDPRFSTADARLLTFEVARIIAVLWEPERLAHGDAVRRKVLAASIRIIQTSAKFKDAGDWSAQDLADYGLVSVDLGGFSADDVESAGHDDDGNEDCNEDGGDSDTVGESDEPDLDDPGGGAVAHDPGPAEDSASPHEASAPPSEGIEGGGNRD